ncbi:MAG: hypothetical protein AAFQ37_11995 [Bacteroidota bacterium]
MTDTNTPLDSGYGDGISISRTDINYLRTAGKWGRFISIVGLAFIGIFVIFMLIGGGSFLALAGSSMGPGIGLGAFFFIVYGIIFAIAIYCYVLLYRFSTNAIKAADTGNASAITEALKSLSQFWKVLGIITAIYIGFFAIFTVFGLGAALFSGI